MDSSSQENHIKIYLVQRSILVVCNSRILCIAIFLYQASICFDQFKNQGGASKTEFVNQETDPRPLVCLTSKGFAVWKFLGVLYLDPQVNYVHPLWTYFDPGWTYLGHSKFDHIWDIG